jgi:hypothetical protein
MRGGAAERVEHVGGSYDPHKPIALHDGQAADQSLSHDVGRLANGGVRVRAHHVRCHQIPDAASLADVGTGSAAEIAFETTPTTRRPSSTTKWRMRRRRIRFQASLAALPRVRWLRP